MPPTGGWPAAARLKSGCDLVITDVVMPDENALELLPKMKKAGSADRHERAKYLNDRDQDVRARRLDYPPTPFDLRELVRSSDVRCLSRKIAWVPAQCGP